MNKRTARRAGISLLALFALIFFLVYTQISQEADVAAFKLVNEAWHVQALDPLFEYASLYGRAYFWVPVVFFAWVLGGRKYKKGALTMVLAFLLIIAVGEALKALYFRPRPFEEVSSAIVLLHKPSDSSFPSGHAMIVFGGATIALLFFEKKYSVPLLLEAALVSYSRVYVGLHYPTDVVAGAALGSGTALLTYAVFYGTTFFDRAYVGIETIYDWLLGELLKRGRLRCLRAEGYLAWAPSKRASVMP